MATTNSDTLLLDTNVLLDATDAARPRHATARRLIERRPDLVISVQIVREYLVSATRPPAANGLGMELADAVSNLSVFRRVLRLLPEEKPILRRLQELLAAIPCRGRVIHDAFLVATMQVHGVLAVVTSNPGDFERFADTIAIHSLDEAALR